MTEREMRDEIERLQHENALLKASTKAHRVSALLDFGAKLVALGCRRQIVTIRVEEQEFFQWLQDDAVYRRYSAVVLPTVETPMRVLVHGPHGLDFRIEHAR